MRLEMILALAMLMAPCMEACAMTLAENGKAMCAIAVASDAPTPEKTAASELAKYLGEVTGARFAVQVESEVPADAPQILVGQCARVKRLLPDVDWSSLGMDGIVIKTCGNALVLAGGRPRGALYAVYTFLEDSVGCHWWTSTESTIPRRPTLTVGALDRSYTPRLRYREAFYRDVIENPLFAARLRTNGHFAQIPEDYGGHYTIIGFVHTFHQWLPPNKYFKDHPEYYSEIEGKRSSDHTQLCLTDKGCLAEMTRVVLDKIRANPHAGMISVSQNDWDGRCECANCKALEEKEGSPSGPLIHFVNAVAEAVDKEFPGTLVETLAYRYTRKPPLHVKPRKNVIVRLCSIECSFANPLDSEVNKTFRDDLKAWSAISPNMYIWNYVTDFASYIQPHPNIRGLAPDLRFFADNHTIGVFEQGDVLCSIGDFVRMRAWVIAHLMWDTSLDTDKLIDEYLQGYYGKAAPYLRRYLDLIHGACEKNGVYLGCYNRDLTFLDIDVMNEATRLFQQAEGAVKNDPALLKRVQRDRMSLDHVWLIRYKNLRREAAKGGKEFLGPQDPAKACEEFIDAARKWDVRNYSESRTFDDYVPELRYSVQPLPASVMEQIKAGHAEITCDLFRLHRPPKESNIVDDPKAATGRAAWMPGSHTKWAVQWQIPLEVEEASGKWHCYALVRCDARQRSGRAFGCGIYHAPDRSSVAASFAEIEDVGDGQYHKIDLGVHDLSSEMYFWIAPPGNAEAVDGVYVDRLVIERQ